jgi:hypothetical protein
MEWELIIDLNVLPCWHHRECGRGAIRIMSGSVGRRGRRGSFGGGPAFKIQITVHVEFCVQFQRWRFLFQR